MEPTSEARSVAAATSRRHVSGAGFLFLLLFFALVALPLPLLVDFRIHSLVYISLASSASSLLMFLAALELRLDLFDLPVFCDEMKCCRLEGQTNSSGTAITPPQPTPTPAATRPHAPAPHARHWCRGVECSVSASRASRSSGLLRHWQRRDSSSRLVTFPFSPRSDAAPLAIRPI